MRGSIIGPRVGIALAILAIFLGAACSGDGQTDADSSSIAPAVIESQLPLDDIAGLERTGRFGPGLEFVLRLPDAWDGRLVVTFPDAASGPTALDQFGLERLGDGTAYASIAAIDAAEVGTVLAEAPAVFLAFVEFAEAELAAHFGQAPESTYLFGVSAGAAQVLVLLEGSDPAVDGAVAVSPRGWEDVLRDYPTLVRGLVELRPAHANLRTNSLSTLSEAELALVQTLLDVGLPRGAAEAWPDSVPKWRDGIRYALSQIDGSYEGDIDDYALPGRPGDVRGAVADTSAEGDLTTRTIILQGGDDVIALPSWSAAYVERVIEADRAPGLRRYVFPGASHNLTIPGEPAASLTARLERAWETLVGWVEDNLEPGPILGIAADDTLSGIALSE